MGRVKRRLAAELGWTAATGFYRQTATAVVRRLARDRRWRTVLAITPDSDADGAFRWPATVPRMAQGPGDLGAKMARALASRPPGPVVLVGTDIPALSARHIDQAFRSLAGHDAVFGPARDGGYWLVGLHHGRRLPDLFADVRWSTEYALADTINNLAPGQSHALIATLDDIDTPADLAAWRQL